MPPGNILAVRLLAVAGAVSLYWLLLLVPLADGMLAAGTARSAGRVSDADRAGIAGKTSFGFAVTFALLRITAYAGTGALANALATLIGAAVFLGGQSRSLLPRAASDAFWRSFSPAPDAAHGLLWLPARALLGAPLPILCLLALAVGAAILTSWRLQRWFAAGAQAVVAGDTGAMLRAGQRPFRAGARTALLLKEINCCGAIRGSPAWRYST